MIARLDSKKCPVCPQRILKGQKIVRKDGVWCHEDCSDLTVYAPPAPANPAGPMTDGQRALIDELLEERAVPEGVAVTLIDFLKQLPRLPVQESLDLRSAA